MDGVIYRCLSQIEPCQDDVLSEREKQTANGESITPDAVSRECQRWGLSVWISLSDVRHARKLFSFVRKRPIGRIKITSQHGVILHTPSGRQPNHRTFWRDINLDLVPAISKVDLAREGDAT
jgi:hypothetical protein